MSKTLKLKIPVGALLVASLLIFFMPILKFSSIDISLLDMTNMSSEVTELMDEFGASSELVKGEINSYFILCILLLTLPVLECILLFTIRGKIGFVVGMAAAMINNVIGYIFLDKIGGTISVIEKAVSFLAMDMDMRVVSGTVVYWLVLYVLIFILSIFGLLKGELRRNAKAGFTPIREILPEEIGPAINSMPQAAEIPPRPVEQRQIQTSEQEKPFHGGLIGNSGIYKEKARLLERNESLLIGTDEKRCDVLLSTVLDGVSYCAVTYDERMKEYWITPLIKNGVFLKSGQPLGKDRVYCLPRGTVISVQDKRTLFQLA